MRVLLKQLRTRLILGSVTFLLGLTVAIVLVVRDSLLFSARNMANVGTEALINQQQASLLEIARREADLSDQTYNHRFDPAQLVRRLRTVQISPGTLAFAIDAGGQIIAPSPGKVAYLFGIEAAAAEPAWRVDALPEIENTGLRVIIRRMQAGESGAAKIEVNSKAVVFAYAPLKEPGWSLAIVEPVEEIAANARPLSENIQRDANRILQATLLTIGYFSILVILGTVLAARALTSPMHTLVEGTRAIAAGDLSVRVPVKSSDELGVLAESFNRMADSLQTRTKEYTEANQAAIENARLFEQARTLAAVEERQRLARELHDSVTQSLYSLTLLAEAARRTALGRDIDKAIENITRLGELAQQALKEMRLLVYELRPLALEQAGLAEALQHRMDAVEKRAGVDTRLVVDLDFELPVEVAASLYRVIEEALNNSLKHAEATSVSVKILSHDRQVEMEITDNGKGFAPDALIDLGGLGLRNIRERAEALGGQATIISKPGEGTLVWIGVPVPKTSG